MRLLAFLAAACFSGAAAAQVYTPGEGSAQPNVAEDQAARLVMEDSKRRGFTGMAVYGKELAAFSPASWVQSVTVDGDRIEIVHERARISVPLADLPRIEVITDTVMGIPQFGVPVTATDVLWVIDASFDASDRRDRAMRLADALYVLKNSGATQGESEVQFEIMARSYRSSDPKPPIPEEVRKYQVQANFAVDLKRYADAARFYAEGIKIAPWWATGRLNRAIVLAEARQYREAITEMRRFLVLAPEAPEARQAQDLIYQWEAAAPMRR